MPNAEEMMTPQEPPTPSTVPQVEINPNVVKTNYRCHKEVYAFKIRKIDEFQVFPEDENELPFTVDKAFMNKHDPLVGGYFVVYKDGYRSFSPAKAFEEGYTKI